MNSARTGRGGGPIIPAVMRSLAIAFLLVFALGFATALIFDRLGTAAGVAAIVASVVLILLMSVVGGAIAGPREPLNLLMDGPHWRVPKADRDDVDFSEFFRALPELSPPDSFLALAGGSWSREVREAVSRVAVNLGDGTPELPGDFERAASSRADGDAIVPITDGQMETFAQLADHHASMEIAMHMAAFTSDGPWLEWFDATGDPISISFVITEESVARFANRIGRKFDRHEGPGPHLPSRKA